ncbi:hypothetical protein N657DRAFT_420178 [Parathielavia appendiculata]|uniref:Secreted protein n=1 Tax=Parathielavia appendiculata TaxID=2587402 RepID=A0AAN6TZU1_9PEZI|nr:hypothetical protein N657DRAFT_420178 [Parathielavia appendiculata]
MLCFALLFFLLALGFSKRLGFVAPRRNGVATPKCGTGGRAFLCCAGFVFSTGHGAGTIGSAFIACLLRLHRAIGGRILSVSFVLFPHFVFMS